MASFTGTIERLATSRRLSAQEYQLLLQDSNSDNLSLLQEEARKAAVSTFGNGVFVRGLLEVSNHCRNNCLYCGIRAANKNLERYRLSKEEILECCTKAYERGFRTFVLQGGEDPAQTDDWLTDVIRTIRKSFPDCAITLSLGEKSKDSYRAFREAGADRYLLRHETFNPAHYSRLHPATMSRSARLQCLWDLKDLGYQTGTGIMVGSPYQTIDNIVEDLLFIQDLRPEMIGIGPFIHHPDTPFADQPDGSIQLTLKLISIFRLMDPCALIPATTALATLNPQARTQGIKGGANVVMPNISPARARENYNLYEHKAHEGAESGEGLEELKKELHSIGYEIVADRGDYTQKRCIM